MDGINTHQQFANPWEYAASIVPGKAPKTEDKPVVKYKPIPGLTYPTTGNRTKVVPVDHPAVYLNGEVVTTSYIVSVEADGSFETRNTRYVLDK